jgi:hypothetical protein
MKAPKIQRRYLARPTAEAWELWAFGDPDGPVRLKSAASCAELSPPPDTVVAVPSVNLLVLPLWLGSQDEGELREMILLQMEAKGFGAMECMEYSILGQEGRQTLVVVWGMGALPSWLADLEMIDRCVPSAFALPLADDVCSLWREAERWTCAVKSKGRVLAMQTFGASRLGEDLRTEVYCLLGQLARDKALDGPPQEILIWGGESAWPQGTLLPVRLEAFPEPIWPEGPGFLPRLFEERRASRDRKLLTKRILCSAGLVLALTLTALVLHTAWLWIACEKSAARVAAVESQVGGIKRAAENWNAVASAVDRDQSAVEILYRCARHIPSAGVRFTLFQIKNGAVLLVGEGDNVSGVVELQNKLANDKELAEYRWKMPPPKILPNNVARFEISGDRLGYASVQK